eukprot:TRINITY_DN8554_c0_g1_i1.p1 TRINITY_DN8554_c0_g1~~TRINITY_DN8554_c0_g1_i1.p1  ORF type:complete len:586 (+),score=99.62 TRINITY_DN8554_c0_g1_i1:345-2102(+)
MTSLKSKEKPSMVIHFEAFSNEIESIGPDGVEFPVTKVTPKEKFQKLFQQISVDGAENGEMTTSSEVKKEEEEPGWQRTVNNLASARMELEGLITLLQMCESNQWFQEVHIDKGEPGVLSKTKFMAVQILSKEQELKNAATKLRSKAAELRSATSQENQHLYDLVKLRKAWRIRHADRRISNAQYLLDYSYVTSGSSHSLEDERSGLPSPMSTELNRFENGLEMKSHASLEANNFIGFSSEESIEDSTTSIFLRSSKRMMTTKNDKNNNWIGCRPIHCTLLKAQFSLFCEELFKKIANEALMGNIPFVNTEEKEIRIEFATQPALLIRLQPNRTESEFSTNMFSISNGSENSFQVIEIVAHSLLRVVHARVEKKAKRLPYLIHSKKEQTKLAQTPLTIQTVSNLYLHLTFKRNLNRIITELVESIPCLKAHWEYTPKPLVSSVLLTYESRYPIRIYLYTNEIVMSGKTIATEKDLVEHILSLICEFIVDQLFREAQLLELEVQKQLYSLTFPSIGSDQMLIITLTPTDFVIDISVRVLNNPVARSAKRRRMSKVEDTLHWTTVVGRSIITKLRNLLCLFASKQST